MSNILHRHADEFIQFIGQINDAREFQDQVEERLWDYNKYSQKVIFLERVKSIVKKNFDEHVESCENKAQGKTCYTEDIYEDVLFFLQNQMDGYEDSLTEEEFSSIDRSELNKSLSLILDDLNKLKLGQEIIYENLFEEVQDLKDKMFLPKKNWMELFAGKVLNMVASGVISETASKDLIELFEKYSSNIISS